MYEVTLTAAPLLTLCKSYKPKANVSITITISTKSISAQVGEGPRSCQRTPFTVISCDRTHGPPHPQLREPGVLAAPQVVDANAACSKSATPKTAFQLLVKANNVLALVS